MISRSVVRRLYDAPHTVVLARANAAPEPFALASYIASSARVINAAAVAPSCGNTEINFPWQVLHQAGEIAGAATPSMLGICQSVTTMSHG